MNRRSPLFAALVGIALCVTHSVFAQDPVAAAAREEAAANYRDLTSKVQRLEEDLNSAQRQLRNLIDENHRLRIELEQQKRPVENATTLERINKLQAAIKQVDAARLEDNKNVLAEFARQRAAIDKIMKIASTPVHVDPPRRDVETPSAPPPRNDTPAPAPRPPVTEHGFEYTIKKGDTLSGILAAAREQKGLKITRKQMEEANPGINWDRLQVGKKIFIPAPASAPSP